MRATENSRARALAAGRRRAPGCSSADETAAASAAASSGGDEQPGLAVDDELGQRADVRRDDRQAGEHRLEHREPEALPARRVHEDVGAAEPGGDVGDAAEQEDAALDAELAREPLERRALGPFAEHDEHDVVRAAARSARIATSIPFCARRGATTASSDARAVRDVVAAG